MAGPTSQGPQSNGGADAASSEPGPGPDPDHAAHRVTALAERLRALADRLDRPVVVAVDGRSGSGKSTLAARLRSALEPDLPTSVIEGDDFYSGGDGPYWDGLSARQKVGHGIDWRRQRPVLQALRDGIEAEWYPYDWEAFDWRLASEPLRCEPTPVVIIEGAYSARPELADLLDLRLLVEVPAERRRRRLLAREGEDYRADWEARWAEAEVLYFSTIMPGSAFDIVIDWW